MAAPTSNFPLKLTGNINQVSGTDSVTINGATTLTLAGTNNWSGPTNLQQGVLVLQLDRRAFPPAQI